MRKPKYKIFKEQDERDMIGKGEVDVVKMEKRRAQRGRGIKIIERQYF